MGRWCNMGGEIRFYRDADGDGRAERREVVLTGFGTQDSPLFAPPVLRQPGADVCRTGALQLLDGCTPMARRSRDRRDRGGVQPVA